MSMAEQRPIEMYEKFGSDEVMQSGSYAVSFLGGDWYCTCIYMSQANRADPYCRHIQKEIIKKLNGELAEKDRLILELTEGGRRHAPHGTGCNYSVKEPSKAHMAILRLLSDYSDGRPRAWIEYRLRKDYRIRMTNTALGGRLSECVGIYQGWASINKGREPRVIREEDGDGCVQFRCNGKRLYYITDRGRELLREIVSK